MRVLKRLGPLVVSIVVVLALGGVGIGVSRSANDKARDVHREDRLKLNTTLASLTDQYISFSFKEVFDAAGSRSWSLRPGDPRDATALEEFVERSALFNHAAALTTLDGQPINAFALPPGLPAVTDPGYAPLRAALVAGRPGLSSVMDAAGAPVVAMAVPVIVRGTPRALLFAYFRADTGPLQVYSERLDHGPNGIGHVVDTQGTVVASSDRSLVGNRLDANPGLEAMLAGHSGFTEFVSDGVAMTATYHPVGETGWGDIVVQPSADFFGPIDEGGRNVLFALLVLLAVAAAALTILNFFRERALRHAYEYKGQLLANTTHELKTPLTAIRGAAITLGTRWKDMHPESVDQLLGMIHRRTEGLAKLVDRILMGARLDAGRELTAAPQEIEVRSTLRGIAADFADASPRHRFTVSSAPDLVATADPEMFDQIVGMLVENAIKYSPEGGHIRLAAVAGGDEIVVHVADNGVGIPDDALPHVFEPYFRAHRGDAQTFGGVGLGLSICRHLVRLNGGEIDVTSRPGQGTTFSFTLPRAAGAPQARTRNERVDGWITVREAAQRANVHPSTVRSWLRDGRVRSETVEMQGRARRVVAVEDLEVKRRAS